VKTQRKQISDALFALVSGVTWTPPGASAPIGFETKGRKVIIWSNVPPAAQPACFLEKVDENVVQDQAFGASKYLLNYRLWLYLRADASQDESVTTEDVYDPMLDAIDTAIQRSARPPFQVPQTLANKVAHTWINGTTLIDPGVLDQQIVCVVPVTVLAGL